MSDLQLVLGALPRIHFACRTREVAVSGGRGALSEHQAHILGHLDTDDPVMVTELAEFMGVTPSTMSLNLTRLERSGFVTRVRDPDDRRVMNVRLTEAGERARDAATPLDPARVDALLRELGPDDRRRAVQGLSLLAEAADALVARGGRSVAPRFGGGAAGEEDDR